MPSLAELGVSQLTVFQRTPCWSPPRLDYQYPAPVKTLFAWLPLANTLHRYFIFWRHEARFKMVFELDGIIAKVNRQVCYCNPDPKFPHIAVILSARSLDVPETHQEGCEEPGDRQQADSNLRHGMQENHTFRNNLWELDF